MIPLDVCPQVELVVGREVAEFTFVDLGRFSVVLFNVRDEQLQVLGLKVALFATQVSAVFFLLEDHTHMTPTVARG